jgi:LDH2 family malate/lactate/ureidoglycolate dehydrogenase
MMPVESAEYLFTIYQSIVEKCGASAEEARIYARCLVNADLTGKDTQGVACLPMTYRWMREGAIHFGAPTKALREGPSFALLDGGHGLPQAVATLAMHLAVEKASHDGVGLVWVCHGNDFLMASNYSTLGLSQDFFGLAMSNGVPLVAAWGGRDPIFNTSPLSFAIPAGTERPIVYDGSTSAVSHGRVVLAARDGKPMEGSPLVGVDGRKTGEAGPLITDPFDRNSEQLGAILPIGAKGFAWLILVEVMSSLMSGMSLAKDIPFNQTTDAPWTGGFFLMAVNIGKLVDLDEFKAKVDTLIRTIKSSKLAEGFDEVVLPGERAMKVAEKRQRNGVPLRDEDWGNIETIAAELGIDLQKLRAKSAQVPPIRWLDR